AIRIISPSGFSISTPMPDGPGLPWEPPSTYAMRSAIQPRRSPFFFLRDTMRHSRLRRQEIRLAPAHFRTGSLVHPVLWKVLWKLRKHEKRCSHTRIFTVFSRDLKH